MLSTLYLLKYNNYYNRILKKSDTLEGYNSYIIGSGISNINFNPNDGIFTEQIINWNNDIPDYLLVVENNEINSRWFVIESTRTLGGQFKLQLFRDTLADYLDYIQDAPIYVEKGPLSESDPFIFNSEGMLFNQIKTNEYILNDRFATPWVVGYLTSDNPVNEQGQPTPYKFTFNRKIKSDYTVETLDDYETVSGINLGRNRYLIDYAYQVHGKITERKKFTISFNSSGSKPINYPNGDKYGYQDISGYSYSSISLSNFTTTNTKNKILNSYISKAGSDEVNMINLTSFLGLEGKDAFDSASRENGKIIYVSGEGKFYKVKTSISNESSLNALSIGTEPFQQLTNMTNEIADEYNTFSVASSGPNANSFSLGYSIKNAFVELELYNGVPVEDKEVEISLGRNILSDAPYCMFAIPFYEKSFYKNNIFEFASCGPDVVLDFVSSLSRSFSGAGILTDIQLLPYCPFQERIEGYRPAVFNIDGMEVNSDYQYIQIADEDGYKTGITLFWAKKATFSFNIEFSLANPYSRIEVGGEVFREGYPWAKKVWNETTKYRLSSPNYSAGFDFSPAKNNDVAYFNVDCTYKPFSPYIHINPAFDGLYGKDFDDGRGLICSGDFSLTQLSDQWQTYQWQNINFEKTFQRQIENMDVQHDIAEKMDWANLITGAVGAGTSGAATGQFLTGGMPGAAVVGGISAAISTAGGIADIVLNKKLRDEAKDYTQDLYNFNLRNIEALPTTISKISAFTANNKIFPLIETYESTEMEREAFVNKLKYNGLTVMRIGTMNEFILYKINEYDYFKGKLIRLENIPEDSHVVNIIASELNKGVFI